MKRAKYIRNQSGLKAILDEKFKPILKKIGEEVVDELKNQIFKDTYFNEYYPNKVYASGSYGFASPTFAFLNSWKSISMTRGSSPFVKIYYDPKRNDLHTSYVTGEYVTEYMDEILNVDGYTSGLMTQFVREGETPRYVSKRRKPYWDNFEKRMTGGGVMRKIIKQKAKENGINLK